MVKGDWNARTRDPACEIKRDDIVRAAKKAGWRVVPSGWRRVGPRGRQEWVEDGWADDALFLMRERDGVLEGEALPEGGENDTESTQSGSKSTPENEGDQYATGAVAYKSKSLISSREVQEKAMGSDACGAPHALLTPSDPAAAATDAAGAPGLLVPTLPAAAVAEAEYPSLEALRLGLKQCQCVGFDTEWLNLPDGDRRILSYQFAWWKVAPDGTPRLFELVAIPLSPRPDAQGRMVWELPSDLVLSVLFDLVGCRTRKTSDLWWYGFRRRGFKIPKSQDDMPEGMRRRVGSDGRPVAYVRDLERACSEENYIYHPAHHAFDEERVVAGQPDKDAPRDQRGWRWVSKRVFIDHPDRILLVGHFLRVDLSAFLDSGLELVRHCTDAGGLFTMQPFPLVVSCHRSKSNVSFSYGVRLAIRDTMAQAPAGKRSLDDLGKSCHVPKVDLDEILDGAVDDPKAHMDVVLRDHPVEFLDYASQDSVVAVTYLATIYGLNSTTSPTLPSGGAKVLRRTIMESLARAKGEDLATMGSAERNAFFDRAFRGYETKRFGVALSDKGTFTERTSIEPVDRNVAFVLDMCTDAYAGGFNECMRVCAHHGVVTHDYDLENAYPTAMAAVPDVDWDDPIMREISTPTELRLSDFSSLAGYDYTTPGVFDVTFEFPEGCRFPSIIQKVEGVPVYVMRSDVPIAAMTPEVLLALKLGAKVTCHRGFFLRPLVDGDGRPSHSLGDGVRQLIQDRSAAKADYGKGSIMELAFKTMANSGYGKTAQGLMAARTYDAWRDEMGPLGLSDVSSPYAAAMTTSFVRAELIAAMTELEDAGISCYSVTTDGFISEAPPNAIRSLDMFGMRRFAETSRCFLTATPENPAGDPTIWSEKHRQDDLINFNVRGNISQNPGGTLDERGPDDVAPDPDEDLAGYEGVCAHSGARTGFGKFGALDRWALARSVATRTGRVESTSRHFTNIKDLVHGSRMIVTSHTTRLSLDYAMKRKPVVSTVKDVDVRIPAVDAELDKDEARSLTRSLADPTSPQSVAGVTLSHAGGKPVAHAPAVTSTMAEFDTAPYADVDEFASWRAAAADVKRIRTASDGTEHSGCLRTASEIRAFCRRAASRVTLKRETMRSSAEGLAWNVLMSCVRGHRLGLWEIPALSRGTVASRLDFINEHNGTGRQFTRESWKNAGRKDRRDQVLDVALLTDKLREMGAVMKPISHDRKESRCG